MRVISISSNTEINHRPQKRWSQEEIQFLKDNYATKGAMFCAEKMPYRTLESIRNKVSRIGIDREKTSRYNQIAAPEGYKHCGTCSQILPISCFYQKGHNNAYTDVASRYCRSCSREAARRSSRKHKSSNVANYKKNPAKKLWMNIKGRAKKNQIPFNLTVDDIIIPAMCPVLHIPIIPFSDSDNSPSIDRLIPELGYTKGNITVISNRANRIKSDATLEELKLVHSWMAGQF